MRKNCNISQELTEMTCDTWVPYYEVGVSCGLPGEMGDLPPEMILLPSMLTRGRQVFIVNAQGDSMQGIGIYSGDPLLLESVRSVRSGEVVMVAIDGEEVLKTYFVDEENQHWLLPANDKYAPILLTEDMDVRFCGRLVCNLSTPRDSISHINEQIRKFKKNQHKLADVYERLAEAVAQGSSLFWAASAWAVVYGVMRDCCDCQCSVAQFERKVQAHSLPASFEFACRKGSVQRTLSNHTYMYFPVDKWAEQGASKRELALMAFMKEKLK